MTLMFVVVGLIGLYASIPLGYIAEPGQDTKEGAAFTWPTAALWGLIVLSLCTNLTEGAMADWAAVYFREVLHAAPWLTGYGFAAYAFWMAAGRFAGDALLMRYNNRKILHIGGVLVAVGLLLSVILPYTPIVLLGFALVGAGVSLGAPILYGSSARAPGMAPGAGLAVLNTFAMAGFLAGPTLIGFIANHLGLPIAFTLVAFVALFWSWKAGHAKGL
jgi:Na+/melibiose symporter-like transporter